MFAVTCAAFVVIPVGAVANGGTHMSEETRASVSRIVILPTEGRAGETLTGSYDEQTPGLLGGMAKGSEIGTIPVEMGGVPVGIPIPILREIGMIAGGISGSAKREMQEFRDRLTEDLAEALDQPLSNDALANDVFWGLRNVASLEPRLISLSTPIPEDTEAILFVSLTDVGINVQEDEAIITTTATARLQRQSDGVNLYRTEVRYEDRDTLSNWTNDDNALWREYRNFARHYIGREISAELFERVSPNHELVPKESETVERIKKDDWQAESKSLSPTLAWELNLRGGDSYGAWVNSMDEGDITWDIEVYDQRKPVYSAKQVRGSSHTLGVQLEACKSYRWTVRPTYHVEGGRKNGEWMRAGREAGANNGNIGRGASIAHAYVQDFASLKVSCRLR
jgi:hypothetical protein